MDLSSQHVTPTTISFFEVPIKAFKHLDLHLLLDVSKYLSEEKSIQGICICELSQLLGPCLGKQPLGLISFCCGQISWF
jgi:hypothetical protein